MPSDIADLKGPLERAVEPVSGLRGEREPLGSLTGQPGEVDPGRPQAIDRATVGGEVDVESDEHLKAGVPVDVMRVDEQH